MLSAAIDIWCKQQYLLLVMKVKVVSEGCSHWSDIEERKSMGADLFKAGAQESN